MHDDLMAFFFAIHRIGGTAVSDNKKAHLSYFTFHSILNKGI